MLKYGEKWNSSCVRTRQLRKVFKGKQRVASYLFKTSFRMDTRRKKKTELPSIGAALPENNEASAELTTAYGGTFT